MDRLTAHVLKLAYKAPDLGPDALKKKRETRIKVLKGYKRRKRAMPSGFWQDLDNQRYYLDNMVAPRMRIMTYDDWYASGVDQLIYYAGDFLMKKHNKSLFGLLKANYPEIDWEITKFRRVPNNHWEDIKNQRLKFDDIGKQLNFKTFDNWYLVNWKQLSKHKCRGLLARYSDCISRALVAIFPQYPWDIDKFVVLPKREKFIWRKSGFFETAEELFKIKTRDDWYHVSQQQLQDLAGSAILQYWPEPLIEAYPSFEWDIELLAKAKKATQRMLVLHTAEIFNNGYSKI